MRKIITGFVMAVFAWIAFLPLTASAAGQQEVLLTTVGEQTEVTLSFPEDAVRENICSLSLSLKITSEKETEAVFHFETGIAKLAEARYSAEDGIMNLYLSNGDKPLFAENETVLKLGTLEVSDAGAEAALVADSVKTVAGTEMKALQNVSGQTKPDGDGADTDNPGGDGGNTDKPDGDGGNTGNPDDGNEPDTKEEYLALLSNLKDTIVLAETYRESDYTPESYNALKGALEEAKKKAAASDATIEELRTALVNLENAIGGLVQNTTSSGESNHQQPEGQEDADRKPAGEGQEGGRSLTEKTAGAKTGDSSGAVLWLGIFAAGLGVLGYALYRRKRARR